jgi:hypothetical protein
MISQVRRQDCKRGQAYRKAPHASYDISPQSDTVQYRQSQRHALVLKIAGWHSRIQPVVLVGLAVVGRVRLRVGIGVVLDPVGVSSDLRSISDVNRNRLAGHES